MNDRNTETYLRQIFEAAAKENCEAVVEVLVSRGIPRDDIKQGVYRDSGRGAKRRSNNSRHEPSHYMLTIPTTIVNPKNNRRREHDVVCYFDRQNVTSPKSAQELIRCCALYTYPGGGSGLETIRRKKVFNPIEIADKLMELRERQRRKLDAWLADMAREAQYERNKRTTIKNIARVLRVPVSKSWTDILYAWGDYCRGMSVAPQAQNPNKELEPKVYVELELSGHYKGKSLSLAGLSALASALSDKIPSEIDTTLELRYDKLQLQFCGMTEAQTIRLLPGLREVVNRFYPNDNQEELPEWTEEDEQNSQQQEEED